MIRGIWAAVLTPIDEDLGPDASRAIPYYRELLERGCDGVNVLGTTGEAMSFAATQRERFMDALAAGGLPMERIMAGTGAASLADCVRLTRRAFDDGYAAALLMPPFFYRDASDDGIVAFFDALLTRTNPPQNRLLLYNFPRMSGIRFHASLVDRLLEEFPGIIAGVKDSSNDANLQTEILTRHPDLAVLPGSESELLAAKRRGVAGCISGSVALWPALAAAVFAFDDEARGEELTRRRNALGGVPFIPAVRYLTAKSRRESEWERPMPPQRRLSPEAQQAMTRNGEGA
jgi:4-hydroxy-tetrahydrodipicolinate synthase